VPDDQFIATVRLAQQGDLEAFTDLVRQFQDMAVGYARTILHDPHLAQDAAQEAFVQMLGDLPTLRDPAAFVGWFRRLVFKFCDRQTRRADWSSQSLPQEDVMDLSTTDPQSEVELQQERAVVHRAIEALPDIQRETVLLYYMGDQSQARIASFLEISEGTVKKRLFDARATLKGSMISMVQDSLHEEAPSRTASFERRVVTSVLPLQVSVWEQPGDIARALGSTVAGRHVDIPENPTFLENSILPENSVLIVEPRLEIDDAAWDRLLGEMKERQIPGLCVEGRLSDRHLERMGELADQLVYLNLSGTNAGITDRGLSHLADLKRLRYLDVNQNGACNSPSLVPANVSDAGMSFLSELTDLEVLYLHNLFSVGDGTARHLKHLTRLRRLGFDATLITDQGFALYRRPRTLDRSVAGSADHRCRTRRAA